MAESERALPYSVEAEQSVLGAILIKPESVYHVSNVIKEEDFYLKEHREIYAAMRDLFMQNREIDLVTLIDMLVSRGTYDKENGSKYIHVIAETVPSASNLDDYMRIVKEKAVLRSLIEAAEEIRDEAYESKGEVKYIVDSAEAKIFNVAKDNETKNFVKISDALARTYVNLQQLADNPEAANGTPTEFKALDNVLVGMGKGDLILIGARPGMGKTSFAMNIAVNVAKKTKKAVCIFSLEMTCEQLAERLISSEAMIESKKLRSGKIQPQEWNDIAQVAAELSETNILIDDTSGISVTAMKGKLRRVKDLGLVVVDYLQLVQGERHAENRVLEVGDISRSLKLLAKDLGVPVICCAQLSRASEGRTDKRPELSDLRDSGAIEQDADVVMFLYREGYYDNQNPQAQSDAECIIKKNRHGETTTVKLGWYGAYTKFVELDTSHEES
ncbi:MAG: replicative DNA helicase [Clostridiales bacterium]|nr:replicative DNA helicase [Clostridiales bacterium]